MSFIFKRLQEDDIIESKNTQKLSAMFSSSVDLRKTVSGWTFDRNTSFSNLSNITGSVLFVDNNKFAISYANEATVSDFSYNLPWHSIMSSIGANYNQDTSKYDYYVWDSFTSASTRITEVIAISLNPEYAQQGIDFDNFFLVMSGSTGNNFTDIGGNGTFDVTQNLVIAPYFVKNSSDNTNTNPNVIGTVTENYGRMTPSYELRTNNNANFLTYDGSLSIKIDWSVGTTQQVVGQVFPEVGLILLFPELFNRAQITTAVRTGDRTLNSLRSLMFIGGYVETKVDKKVYFVRLNPNEFNFTLNDSAFVSDGTVTERIPYLADSSNSRTFPTQIGLYNDANECLVVANFSKPEEKTSIKMLPVKIEIEV
jgi:hypothetical protein